MKGSKILATIVVLAMVFSSVVVFERLDIKIVDKAGAIPGIDAWGYTTDHLEYDPDSEQNFTIDCRNLTADTRYYIYYPRYWRSGSTTYNLSWRPYLESSVHKSFKVPASGANTSLSNIILNRSGIWAFSTTSYGGTGTIKGNSWANWNSTADGWFWVNTSTSLSLGVSPDEVYYGQNETISLSVTKGGASAECWLDIRRENGTVPTTSIGNFPLHEADGKYSFSSDWLGVMRWAGNYSVIAYSDLDGDDKTPNYQAHNAGHNSTFGSNPSITAGYYNYAVCGPWDPPEYNSTYYANKLVQLPGEPSTTIQEANQTMYWGFDGQVNITVKNYDGENISGLNVYVYNSDDQNVTSNLSIWVSRPSGGSRYSWIWINSSGTATATANGWGRDSAGNKYGTNGTWYAWIFRDIDGDLDHTTRMGEEWNTTVEWTVASAPGSQFKWLDDDGSLSSDNSDGVIPYVPSVSEQPINLRFQIVNDNHQYYGADASSDALTPKEKGKNITITGDALFLSGKTLDKLPGVSCVRATGTWTLPLTPTMAMNGGELTIKCKWKGNGTVTETLSIGGPKLNGTIVTISPSEFTIDENVSLTVTVHDQGYAIPNAQVWLYYIYDSNRTLVTGPGLIEYRNGGGSFDGEYEFLVNTTQQTTNQTLVDWDGDGSVGDSVAKAPRNISAYVKYYRGGTPTWTYGYAKATMKPKTDFKVTMEPNVIMAGQKIKKLYFNTTKVDESGNSTGWPKDSGLKVRIYNETGEDVTTSIGSLSTSDTDGKANKTASNEYFQKPGTYTVHAYNNTHNSEGNNATLTIVPVNVVSSLSELIWGVDENVSTTLTVTYDGKPVNGTLRIDNMSEKSVYNKTWTNCSFSPVIGSTSGSDAKNTSMEVKVENGVVTISNITANNLSEYLSLSTPKWYHYSMKNITFYFKPDVAGSAWASTDGVLPVKIADVSASPKSLVYNKPATLELTVTGRGVGLGNVFTSVVIPGLSGEMNTTTSADGTATFAFTPPTTGEIAIKIENRTSSTKVQVRSWALYLDVDTQANEGVTFTATVRNGSASGAAVQDATVTFNKISKTTDSSGQVTFDAPSVVTTREFTIVATKEGFAEDSEIIYILNIPKLMIVVQGEISAGATFDLIIADDGGNPVVGATITINKETFTTGANGIAKITAPSEEGDYTITATFPGYTDADPVTIKIKAGGIPGFELLTLIAAIGVAFILLRRRQH